MRDLTILLNQWREIQERLNRSKQPTCLYTEPDIIERTVRDFLTETIDRVCLSDDEADGQRMIEWVGRVSKAQHGENRRLQGKHPIFERFNIERQIEQTFQRRVPLPSGGEIVIEETEALVAIDVNTGAHKNKERQGQLHRPGEPRGRHRSRPPNPPAATSAGSSFSTSST